MLSLTNVQAAYGSSRVLFDVNLEVPDGKIVTLLGRNGMGKTTTVRAIMGLVARRRASRSTANQSMQRRARTCSTSSSRRYAPGVGALLARYSVAHRRLCLFLGFEDVWRDAAFL